jgi:hypothetical protein
VAGRSQGVVLSFVYWSLRRLLELVVLRCRSEREKEIEILLLLAYDDVVRMRAQVEGQWRPVQVVRNTVYAEFSRRYHPGSRPT